jgi:hypothetical protein
MPADFIPLVPNRPASNSTAEFKVRILPSSSPSPASVDKPLPASHVHAGKAPAEPTVTLQKEGDQITGIRIQCSCGQIINLSCQY